jgi:hypothetical protein
VQQTVLVAWRRDRRSRRWATVVLLIGAAMVAVSCGLSDDMLGREAITTADTPSDDVAMPPDDRAGDLQEQPGVGGPSEALRVTRQQRGYLDALGAAGVPSSSELRSLSIGSSVCQARAAKQSDQAVWDFILPLVRSDVRATRRPSERTTAADVDTATADYIRIATERLC